MSTETAETIFKKSLLQGEEILWSGKPDPSVFFTTSDLFLIPFSMLWFGFALFWEISVLLLIPKDQPVGMVFPLFGLFFVIVGFYFALGRFIYKRLKKEKTFYALTNKRVLMFSNFINESLQTVFLKNIADISKSRKKNGTGSITFGHLAYPFAAMYTNTGLDFFNTFYGGAAPAFYDIKDVDKIYNKINKIRAGTP